MSGQRYNWKNPPVIFKYYLEMRYEVRRDAPLCLDSGATSLAVRLNLAILTFEDNIKIIQNRHLRHWRHRSTVPPLQGVINLRPRTISLGYKYRLSSWAQASVFAKKKLLKKWNKNKIYFAVGAQKKFLLQAGARRMDDPTPRAAADVWKCQYFKATSAVRTLSSDVWRRQIFVETRKQ